MQCFKFLKVMMFLFNLIIFLCGAALLAVGIWVSVDGTSFLKIFGPLSSSAMQFVNVGYFLIAAGAVLFILGFLGCYGAHSESKCALMMAEQFLTLLVVPAIKKDYGSQTEFTQVWNSTMDGLKCCGFNNYTDFNGSHFVEENKVFPSYCCGKPGNSTEGPCTEEKAQSTQVQGCFKQLLHDIRTNAVTVGGVAVGIAALELAAMIVSMYLYCNLK
ncbi:tetraspanin-1 isoform X2 [Peromyscus californicus insignis]|uniref:tetraspanin-1 isoform X2 n=1 Tax=Peromyscus californicus insignis TaxID=564181 RepID=UPI0022A6BB34|nr:tetraspanin-1 isoform X2 [Peromyscus californicus insignis]